jgi:hypothetical protein
MRPFLVFLVSLILAPFIAGIGVEIARPYLPEVLPAALAWLAMLADWPGLPWIVGSGIGLIMGLCLDRFVGWFDGRHPITKSGRARSLASEADSLGDLGRVNLSGSLQSVDLGQAATRCMLLVRKLKKIGVIFPQESLTDKTDDLKFLTHQFRCIAPALREGDIGTANSVIIATMRNRGPSEE